MENKIRVGVVVVSSVDFIKWAGVPEAGIPNLVDNPGGMGLVFTSRTCAHRNDSSSSNAFLMLLCELPLPSAEEFPGPSTLAAERACTNLDLISMLPDAEVQKAYLGASSMSKVIRPVHLEP